MRITNICINGLVTDGFHYQDNLITKYQKRLGNDVTIITSKWILNEEGNLTKDNRDEYINEHDVRVIRLEMKGLDNYNRKFKKYPKLYETIEQTDPDVLFLHGVSCLDDRVVVKYLKLHPDVVGYADNHGDFFNSATNWLSRIVLHNIIWRYYVKKLLPYMSKFYGVLPARVDFLCDMYGVPREKCELLLMGADDEIISGLDDVEVAQRIRKKYNFIKDGFIIVSGGKINEYRSEVLNLMAAVEKCTRKNQRIQLVVFGSVSDQIKERFLEYLKCPSIVFLGWISSIESYEVMKSADVVCFPGLHSVMWEQAVALGIPCIFKDIKGFHHVDIGGNAIFVKDSSEMELENVILDLLNNPKKFEVIKVAANDDKKKIFLYSRIARQSLQMNN